MLVSELFQKYVQLTHATVSPGLLLKESTNKDGNSSGFGLFLQGETVLRDIEPVAAGAAIDTADNILLRIPSSNTFDIYTILHILLDKEQYENVEQYQQTNNFIKLEMKEFFKEILPATDSGLPNELVIITFYFILFEHMKVNYKIPYALLNYLNDILLQTRITSSITCPELTTLLYPYHPNLQMQEIFVNNLYEFFHGTVPKQNIRQIFASITSRVLEIPHETDEKSENFTVNTTLVPLLDFVNHRNPSNCYFDVDRSNNNDIVLKFSSNKTEMHDDGITLPIELFISYNPKEELINMVSTYGFVPETVTQLNVYMDQDWLKDNNYEMWSICSHSEIAMAFQLRATDQLLSTGAPNWQIYDYNLDKLSLCYMQEIHTVYRPQNGQVGWSRLEHNETQLLNGKLKLVQFLIKYLEHRQRTLQSKLAQAGDHPSAILAECATQEINIIDHFLHSPYRNQPLSQVEPIHLPAFQQNPPRNRRRNQPTHGLNHQKN